MQKDGSTPLPAFRPNDRATRNEFITVFSRLLYDGRNNIALTSPLDWYINHTNALRKANLLTDIPARITQSFVIYILKNVKENPNMVQR